MAKDITVHADLATDAEANLVIDNFIARFDDDSTTLVGNPYGELTVTLTDPSLTVTRESLNTLECCTHKSTSGICGSLSPSAVSLGSNSGPTTL